MALDLLKRTAGSSGLLAVEKIALLYGLLTALLIVLMFGQLDHPGQMLLERLAITGATLLLATLYRLAPCKLFLFLRIGMQMGLLAYWYPDTYEFNRFFPNLDHLFASAEQWMFGGQPANWFSQALPHWWVSEAIHLGYFFYYPMIFIVAMFYFFFRYEQFEKFSFIVVTTFFIYYLIYIFLPVAGPQYYFPAIGMDQVAQGNFPALGDYFNHNRELLAGPGYDQGLFYNLVEGSQQAGERPTAAFPSSHVGVSTLLMILAWRGSRKLFTFLLPFYLLLCCATVYIQAHYLIDAIVGFISAFLFYFLVEKIYQRWFAPPLLC